MGLESSIIHDSLSLQGFKKTGYVFRDLPRISRAVLSRQRCYDLLDRALTIAEFQDVLACPLYSDHAFGEEYNLLFVMSAPSTTWCQAGLAGFGRRRHSQASIRKAPGGGQP